MTWPKPCRSCKEDMYAPKGQNPGQLMHDARGLCTRCYRFLRKTGGLHKFPALTRSNAVVMEEWAELRDAGYTVERAAQMLGMTFVALDRAIHRANEYQRRSVAA